MKLYFVLIASFFVPACKFSEDISISQQYIIGGELAINLCVKQYVKFSGKRFFSDVDQALVMAADGKFDIIFTQGGVWEYAKKGENYHRYLGCGVYGTNDNLKIYFLEETNSDPMFENTNVHQIAEEAHAEIWHMLYLRDDLKFSFTSSKRFYPEQYILSFPQ